MQTQLIITADDFGIALPVNEAIELGHRNGVLTTTSLLVGERAAKDALMRAARNPDLRVGLHVAVCDGRPTLPPSKIPKLVNRRGELRHPIAAGLLLALFAFSKKQRMQLEAEIRAQFETFRQSQLELDHVNAHNNMQLHPVVLPVLMRVALEYGARAMRLPFEPLLPSWRAAGHGLFLRCVVWLVMRPWCAYVKRRMRRHGFVVNDYLFGMFDYGNVDAQLMRRMVEQLPVGISEIHCHPAVTRHPEFDRELPNHGHVPEFLALTDPAVREAVAGVCSISGYGQIRSVLVEGSSEAN